MLFRGSKIDKFCSCGNHFDVVPEVALPQLDFNGKEVDGWVWECKCGSTILVLKRTTKKLNPEEVNLLLERVGSVLNIFITMHVKDGGSEAFTDISVRTLRELREYLYGGEDK